MSMCNTCTTIEVADKGNRLKYSEKRVVLLTRAILHNFTRNYTINYPFLSYLPILAITL
jgi:hypothetical protein